MAKTYRPYVPEQDLLLPPSVRDWLPSTSNSGFSGFAHAGISFSSSTFDPCALLLSRSTITWSKGNDAEHRSIRRTNQRGRPSGIGPGKRRNTVLRRFEYSVQDLCEHTVTGSKPGSVSRNALTVPGRPEARPFGRARRRADRPPQQRSAQAASERH
jgi:hypothetical protein